MRNKILSLSLVLSSALSFAESPSLNDLGISQKDIEVITELANAKVPHGKFKGQPLNTAVRRPLYVLGTGKGDSQKLRATLNSDTVTIANFYHAGEFYIARLPVSAVNSVVLLEAPFSPVASHTMLRFATDSKSSVELIAKIESLPETANREIPIYIEPLEKPLLVKDMVLSIDGAEPRGQGGWNLKDAVRGLYTISYRMVSIQERFRWFVLEGTPIHQTKLNLTPEEAQRTLRLGIEKSQTIAWSRPYRLLSANCTNLALRLVKESNPYKTREVDFLTPLKKTLLSGLDVVLRFLEPLTQFTLFNMRTLGWIEKNQADLQKDPAFRTEMEAAVSDFRESIISNGDLSEVDKEKLMSDLGIDSKLTLINNPQYFKSALASYKNLLLEKNKQKSELTARMACVQALAN